MLKKKKVYIGLSVVAIVVSSIITFLIISILPPSEKIIKTVESLKNVDVENAIVTRNKIYTQTNDPKVFFKDLSSDKFDEVIIDFSNPIEIDTEIQLFYTYESNTFNENQSVRQQLSKGANHVALTFPKGEYSSIRIDFGDMANEEFNIASIQFKDYGVHTSIIEVLLIFVLLVFAIFCFLAVMYKFIDKKVFDKQFTRQNVVQEKKYGLICVLFFVLLFMLSMSMFSYSISYASDKEGQMNLFYATSEETYSEEHKITETVHDTNSNMTKETFDLPLSMHYKLRLDIDGIDRINIKRFEVRVFGVSILERNYHTVINVNDGNIMNSNECINLRSSGKDTYIEFQEFGIKKIVLLIAIINLFIAAVLTIAFLYLIKTKKVFKNKKYEAILIGTLFIGTMVLTFHQLFNGMMISPTNFMYNINPWLGEHAKTLGPYLSDQADAGLPQVYNVMKNGFHFWFGNNSFGISLNPFIYLFDYFRLLVMLFFNYGTTIATLAEYSVAFIGMYLLLRQFNCKKLSCYIGGILFCFSSAIVMWGQWDHSTIISLAPFMFLFIDKFIEKEKIFYIFPAVAVLVMMFAANMIAYVGYFMYLLGCFVVFKIWQNRKNKKKIIYILLGFCSFVILGVASSFFFYSELFESVLNSGYLEKRMESDYSQLVLNPEHILQALQPYVDVKGLHINEREIFTGVTSIVLLVIPFITKVDKKFRQYLNFWYGIIIALGIALFTHLLDTPIGMLPVINTSMKLRLLVLLNFSLPIISAYIVSGLLEKKIIIKKKTMIMFTCYITILMIVYLTCIHISGSLEVFVTNILSMNNYNDLYFMILILLSTLVFLILMFIYKRKTTVNIVILMLCIVSSFEMGLFASNYIPYLETGKKVIPDSPKVVKYLQKMTTDRNRISSKGLWNFPPNMNVYYDLNNFRAHAFSVTKKDIKEFMLKTDQNAYVTNTVISLTNEVNNNLLSYSGVKYILNNVEDSAMIKSAQLKKNSIVQKSMNLKENENYSSLILKINKAGIGSKIIVTDNEKKVYGHILTNEDFVNETVVYLELANQITVNKSHQYQIQLEAFNDLTYGAQNEELDVTLYHNPLQYIGGYFIEQLQANDRVFLTRDIQQLENSREILNQMGNTFIQNQAYISGDEENKISNYASKEFEENEKITSFQDKGDSIQIKAVLNKPSYLVLSDYFDKNWECYVNGEKTDIFKTNYLFRGVQIKDIGSVNIVFQYNTTFYKIAAIISLLFFSITLLLLAFSRKIQTKISNWL